MSIKERLLCEFLQEMSDLSIDQEDYWRYSEGWFLAKTRDPELSEELDNALNPDIYEEDEEDY